ncbi:MAG: HlyD family type I secretion periplasmic adaptor subunit [Hyphomicrobiaceae bacterium]
MSAKFDDTVIAMAPQPSADYQSTLRRGYGSLALILLVLFGVSFFARIDSGVVAAGAISVESNRKTVQHLEGGIVSEILVRDGDVVKQGDVLMRLDQTRSAASEELYRKQQAIALALEARLLAQVERRESLVFPPAVNTLASDPMVQSALVDNQRQFEGRRNTFISAMSVLESQALQAQKDMSQARSDKQTVEQQLASVQQELAPLEELLTRGLVPKTRVTTLQRQEQQLQGMSSKADIDLARSTERVVELESKQKQLRQEYSQEAATAIPEVRKTLSDLQQQLVIARDTLKRVDIFAPVAGTVQQLRIFTIGGVIRPGDPVVDIVPDSAKLVVKARVSPIDVDRVRPGMPVEIRLPQFQNYQSEVMRGEVRNISRDTLLDETNRQPYYAMEADVDRSSIPAEINSKLVAGMSTEVIVPTGERTLMQYLLSPLLNRLAVSMRER